MNFEIPYFSNIFNASSDVFKGFFFFFYSFIYLFIFALVLKYDLKWFVSWIYLFSFSYVELNSFFFPFFPCLKHKHEQ